MSDLKLRVVSGSIAMVILIIALYLGGYFFKGFLYLLSLLMTYELVTALRNIDFKIPLIVLFLGNTIHFFVCIFKLPIYLSVIINFLILALYTVFDGRVTETDLGYGLLATFYIPYLLYPIMSLMNTIYLYMVFVIAFSTDTFAYFIGSKLGRHKLMPKISPKKSIEGAIGGTLSCVIISIIILNYTGHTWNPLTILAVTLMSGLGQVGDLFASKIKRQTGIKDFGHILPGHGGILDRLDSMLFIIPIMYLYTQFFI